MSHSGSSQALVGDLGRPIRLPELATAVQAAFYYPIARVLEAGAEDGSLRRLQDPQSGSVSIFGALMMTALLHNVIESGKAASDVADGVMELVLNGLAPAT
jgi:hypothetical protein